MDPSKVKRRKKMIKIGTLEGLLKRSKKTRLVSDWVHSSSRATFEAEGMVGSITSNCSSHALTISHPQGQSFYTYP